MTLHEEVELSRNDLDAFLSSKETGVLALARGDEPYAIPISYGYDRANQCFYLRLVSTEGSEKRRYLASSPRARLVIYENEDDTYDSVIVDGTLEERPKETLGVDDIVQFGTAKRPLFEMWGAEKPDLDVQLYRLEPKEISGRRIDVDRNASAV